VKEFVEIELSGKKFLKGILIDKSSEIVVLFDGSKFIYISVEHIQQLIFNGNNEDNLQAPLDSQSVFVRKNNVDLTLAHILSQARSMYIEIYVVGNQSLHGTISTILNDYFVFHSPIYKTMLIPVQHLKWLIPHTQEQLPYGLAEADFLKQSTNQSFLPDFKNQIAKMKNELVVINLGEKSNHIGKINSLQERMIELQTANINPTLLNVQHIKTIHQV